VEVFEIAVGGSTALPTRFGSTSPHDFTVVSVHVFSLRPTCSFVEPAMGPVCRWSERRNRARAFWSDLVMAGRGQTCGAEGV